MVRIAPYRTQEDRIAGIVATFIDITRRKWAEDEVRAGAARYQTLFDLVPVAVYATDAEGVIREFNRRKLQRKTAQNASKTRTSRAKPKTTPDGD